MFNNLIRDVDGVGEPSTVLTSTTLSADMMDGEHHK